MKTLNREAMIDLLTGCTILGTGGGGDFDAGMRYVDAALDAGKTIRLAGIDEMQDDTLTCMPYALGATRASSGDDPRYTRLPRTDVAPVLLAMQRLSDGVGRRFGATIACELGGENTAVAAFAAAMTDAVLLDADTAGRAVPEVQHSTYFLHGLPASPVVFANEFGETLYCDAIFDDIRVEEIARAFAAVSRDDIAAVDHPLSVGAVREAVIPGTLGNALSLGVAVRRAVEDDEDPAGAIAGAGQGIVAFRGRIAGASFRTEGGFTIGHFDIAGNDDCHGERYRIDVRNENMVAFRNGELDASIPDLITVVDGQTGATLTNPVEVDDERNVAVVVLPAPAAFTTPAGLALFGPAYIGLAEAFVSPFDRS